MQQRRPLPDLSIRQLEYLVAVAGEPTWAAAAASVGVSPSALSQGLAELERRLGVELFERDGRRRLLREDAHPAVTHARQVLGLTGDLTAWADRVRTGTTGRVRLGMIDAAAVLHFPDVLQAFRADHPDVEVLLSVAPSADLLDQLEGGRLDLVVCVEPPVPRDGVEVAALIVEELAVYGPPGTEAGQVSTWGPWVLYPHGSHTRTLIMDRLRSRGARLDVVGESHQPDVLREMVRLGTGWTVLPRSQAELGERALTPGPMLLDRRLVAATRRASIHAPAVEQLLVRLHDAVRRGEGTDGGVGSVRRRRRR